MEIVATVRAGLAGAGSAEPHLPESALVVVDLNVRDRVASTAIEVLAVSASGDGTTIVSNVLQVVAPKSFGCCAGGAAVNGSVNRGSCVDE